MNKLEPQDLIWLQSIVAREFAVAKENQDMQLSKQALRILNIIRSIK
jgi:hypothetical protein